MSKIKLFIFNYKKFFFLLGLFWAFIVIIFIHKIYFKNNSLTDINLPIIEKNDQNDIIEQQVNEFVDAFVKVDIKGEIKKPGVYQLEKSKDRRINDVIIMAGGLTTKADTSVTNLSKKVFDEMIIIIYSKDEVKNFIKTKEEEKIKNQKCQENYCNSCIDDKLIDSNDKQIDNNLDGKNNLININTASKEELMTINGLGESKAQSIIEYRQEKLFEKIEDIMNVSGIGESVYNKIKNYITV